jgi:PD-(D/E)XK nuclease superfamily/Exodeoxyribonuclease V, gamma subunit
MDLHLYSTALSRDRALREIARRQGALFDHRHFTYPEVCERLYRAEGVRGQLLANPAQTVFVRHSLTTVLGEAPSPGLVAEYRGVIDELKSVGLEVAEFARCLDLITPEIPHSTRSALRQAFEVVQHYQRGLDGAGLVDRGDRDLAVLARLKRHIIEGTKPALLRDVRRVIVHDVYHLSLVHYAFVSLLIKLVEDGGVLQHFSGGMNVDAVTFAEYTWQRFVADESLANRVLPEFARPRRRGGNLEALSERLFTRGHLEGSIAPDGTLTVMAAPGRASEVEAIARHIRELLAQGVSPEQVAIVVRNLDQYGELLESVFRRYRIPLWFRRGIPLFHVALTKTLFSLLELASSTYPRAALVKLLTSAYLRPESEWPDDVVGLVNAVGYLDRRHAALPARLDAYVRRQQPNAGEARKIKALAAWVEALHTALDHFVENSRPFLGFLEALKALLLQLGFFRAMGMQPEVPLHVVQRDREALRLIFDTLWTGAEALRLLGDAPLAFSEFQLLAIDLLREVTLDQPSQDHGAVRVLGVHDLLGLDFGYVFVPGLADTEFPRHYTEHPVLDDEARHALNRAARVVLAEKFADILDRRLLGKPLMTTAERAREEPVLFFLALEAANQRCVLSYSTRTVDGEAIFPSMFVDEVLRHFRESDDRAAIVTRLPALPSVSPPCGCLEPGELLRRAALAWRAGGAEGSVADQAALDDMLRSQGIMIDWLRQLARIEAVRKRYLLDAVPLEGIDPAPFGDIGRQIDLRHRFLDSQRPWSPTMLEDAATCPFAFFAKHALHLAPRAEPDYDVSPLVLGELAHGILTEFLKTAPPREAPAAVQRMRVIAERVFAQHIHDPCLGHPGFWMVRKAELVAVLDDLAAYMAERGAGGYRTCYHERDMVGVAASRPWSVWLQGRVDRVAIREGPSGISGILVQDFKYSGNVERYRGRLNLDAIGRLSFQLPVYLYLALQQLEQDGYQLAADAELRLEYLLLKDPGRKAWDATVSPAFLEPDRAEGLFHGVQGVIEQVIAGRFAPRPAEGKQTCGYCAFTALCRYWTSGAAADAWRGHSQAHEEP